MIRKLAGFINPAGIKTDRMGNLYVADSGNAEVKIYAPPYATTPTTIIADAEEMPADVAVFNTGAFAVTNSSTTSQGDGSIMLFAAKATTPCATVYQRASGAQLFQSFA